MPTLKIFISSPGDVPDERLRADLIVDKVSQDYARFFTLSTYRWEHEPMLASGHFQDAIEPPSATDILILIVWSRLGTPLPEKTSLREYRGIDGRVPVTGTEWEFEDALAAARAQGTPDILAFRNTRPALIESFNPDARAKSLAQLDALDQFWRRHFADKGVFVGASESYETLETFAHLLEQKLRKLIERRIARLATLETGAKTRGPLWHGSPFRGLQAYEFEHAPIYFGRDNMVMRAARHIAMAARHGNAFLLVAGASGSGKSSLVKAALLPRLMKPQRIEGLAFLRRVVFRPSDAPDDVILGLAMALSDDVRGHDIGLPELLAPGQSVANLATHLRAVAESPAFVFEAALAQVTRSARQSGLILAHEEARAILVIDQLEEIFTLTTIPSSDRTLFVKLMVGLAKSGLVWVIATMRSDFWHRTADIPDLLALAAGERRLDVGGAVSARTRGYDPQAGRGGWALLRIGPRQRHRPRCRPGKPRGHGARRSSAPVLHARGHLRDGRDRAQRKSIDLFRRAKHWAVWKGRSRPRAEEIVAGLPASAQAAVPRVLRALTTVSDGVDAIAVGRTAPLDSFPPLSDARRVVDALTAGRLLVASGDGRRGTVRVAHEALIAHWKRAEAQVAADRRDLETRKLVERQFRALE